MYPQDRSGAEIFPTAGTSVGLLPQVDLFMDAQGSLLTESLPARQAFERLLVHVDFLVDGQRPLLPEALLAMRASVRLLSCVNPLVGDEVGAGGKGFLARGTPKGSLTGMNSAVGL